MANKKMEYRSLTSELRADGQGDEMAIAGYAALFNSLSKELGAYREVIKPGAFQRALTSDDLDCRALVNHDPNLVLARTKNGTLKLEQDARGLKFRCVLNPESQAARDLYSAIKRGDYDSMSFAFNIAQGGDDFSEATDERGAKYALRTLKDIGKIQDISVVSYPAYNATSVSARAMSTPDYADNDAAWLASKKRFLANLTEQIEREGLCESILNQIMTPQTAEQRAQADRELKERMANLAGRTTR
jgi:HK97 family phage prohead protease